VLRRFGAQTLSLLLHLVAIALLIGARTLAPPQPAYDADADAVASVADPSLPPQPTDTPLPQESDPQIPAGGGFEVSELRVGELNVDIEKIRARSTALFPFLTLDLKFLERVPQDVRRARERLANPSLAARHGAASQDVLLMTDETLQATVDGAWSRRQRWKTFTEIAQLVSTHSPSQGRASELIRGYLDQNILQPYCDDTLKDPRFWAMLENAADHVDFIDFVRSYTRRHPSSKTTTELLFLLDELAQGSRDVMIMVIETRPERDLQYTASLTRTGFELAKAVKQHYGQWLFDRQLDKPAVRALYDALRLRLLSTIVETTPDGYRASDARYLAGEILFNQDNLTEAHRVWRSMRPGPRDAYFRASSEVLEALDVAMPSPRELRRVLQAEYGRWRVYSIDRLRHFGHSCNTF
jgi:hypothetical protein